jgi:glycosyltransferase involved in cell wall biosynthesis
MELTALILTADEEVHIERCLRSLLPVAGKIFVVDSFSTDRTVEIARSFGVEVAQHPWKNYADQFQWAIDHCGAQSGWLMRIDADEYLEPDAQKEIKMLFPKIPDEIDGIYIQRKVFFEGQWIRYGGFNEQIHLRFWRTGKGHIEQRWMDEHIVLAPESKTFMLKGQLVDDNLKGMTFWINKHNKYATREAVDLLNNKYHFLAVDADLKQTDYPYAKWKRVVKDQIYTRLPAGLRAFLYFIYRYFFLLGFLDGRKGFLWHFMQGYWYRLLVDVKIMEIEERSQGDVQKMCQILQKEHGIRL